MGRISDRIREALWQEWLESGVIAPEQLEAWETGAEPVPELVARDALALFGIPLGWWPEIRRTPRLPRPRRPGKKYSQPKRRLVYSSQVEPGVEKRRGRGRPPKDQGNAVFQALKGGTLKTFLKGTPWSVQSASHWIMGRYVPPEAAQEFFRDRLGIPASFWVDQQNRFRAAQRAAGETA